MALERFTTNSTVSSRNVVSDFGRTIEEVDAGLQNLQQNYGVGSGANQVDEVYFDSRTLSTSETLDLNALTMNQRTINFTTIKYIQIINNDAAAVLNVGGGPTPAEPFPSAQTIQPGGKRIWEAPVDGVATAGANNLLLAGAASHDYSIIVAGVV